MEMDKLRLRAKLEIRDLRKEFNTARNRGRDAKITRADYEGAEVEGFEDEYPETEGDGRTEQPLQELGSPATGEPEGLPAGAGGQGTASQG
jgi:hypothetical protein